MSGRQAQVGFSLRVRLEWLDLTADLAAAEKSRAAVSEALQELLRDKVSVGGHAHGCTRDKTIGILLKIWLDAPGGLQALRDDGLRLLRDLEQKERIAVHWGMAAAVYPFWGAVAAHAGRMLRLQGEAAAAHVQRRLRERYGERETVSRAARRVLRTFVDWGVLRDAPSKGVYVRGERAALRDPALTAWLLESCLRSGAARSAAMTDLLDSPSLFPFALPRLSAAQAAAASPRLDAMQRGLDDDLLMLRENGGGER